MILSRPAAKRLMPQYQEVLVDVLRITGVLAGKPISGPHEAFIMARNQLVANATLLDTVLTTLEEKGNPIDDDIAAAIRTMRVEEWCYAGDRDGCSVFFDKDSIPYGVIGINDRISSLMGGAGYHALTAVMRLDGRYVCDGLLVRYRDRDESRTRTTSELMRDPGFARKLRRDCTDEAVAPGHPDW